MNIDFFQTITIHRAVKTGEEKKHVFHPCVFLICSSDKYEIEVHITLLPISMEAFPLSSNLRHSTLSVRQQ